MSVGHVSRGFEEAGIPSVVIIAGPFRHRAQQMKMPRAVVTRNIPGHTISAPGHIERQREVLTAALRLLESATSGGAIFDMPGIYEAAPSEGRISISGGYS